MMINKQYVSILLDQYKELLTDTQREVIIDYVNLDLSLYEIAEMRQTSRAAVCDSIKKTSAKLHYFESKLRLVEKNEKIKSYLESIKNEDNYNDIHKIKEIIDHGI